MTDATARPSVAMVIGSGSVKSAAAIGVKQVLEAHGIDVSLYVGCSAGSIYASVLALGWTADEAAEGTARLWTRDLTSKPLRGAMLKAIRPRLFGFSSEWGLRDPEPVVRATERAVGDATFADTVVPLRITATDLECGDQVVLDEGSVLDAIRASISIPFIFPPKRIGDRLLVDGYLSDPLPVGVAMKEGAQTILAVGFDSPYQRRITSPPRFAFQISSVMTNNLLRSKFAFHNLAHHGEVIPIVPQFPERIGLFETEKMPMIIECGAKEAEEQLDLILSSVEAAPS